MKVGFKFCKGTFTFLLILFITMNLFACESEKTKDKGTKNSITNNEKGKEKRYKITWTMHLNEPVPKDAEILKRIEDKLKVEIDIWNLENSNYERLLEFKLAAGEIPDLFRIRQPQDLLKYKTNGVLAEIPKNILLKNAPNIINSIKKSKPKYLDYGKIEGKYYGIPVINDTNIFRIPVVYRKDWLDRLGLKVPETLDEFQKVIYAFVNNDPDGNGIKDTYGLSKEGLNVVFGAFGQIVYADQIYFNVKKNKLVIGAIEPEMKEALFYLQRWYRDGVIDPEFVTGENKGGYKHLSHAFINGRIGMTSMGNYYHWIQSGDYKELDNYGKEVPVQSKFNALELSRKNPKAKIEFAQPFKGPHGKRGSRAYNILMSFTSIGVNAIKEPGKLEKVLQVLDYVSANPDLEEYMTMTQGMKGKHWEWSDKSTEETMILPPYDKMDNYTNVIGANIGMAIPKKLLARRERWSSTLGLEKNGIYNAMETSTPALMKNGDELIKLMNKAYISIITGDKPVSYFDTFVQEFLNWGGRKVLQEANQWYQSNKNY